MAHLQEAPAALNAALNHDEDIAAMLSYVRANKDWGNNASFVKPETVKHIREATAQRGEQWTADELLKVPETE